MMQALLPPNATTLERVLTQGATAQALPVPIDTLWDPERCPAALLPWLAWTFRVEDWNAAWSEARKRAVIAEAITIHRLRGTVAAVRRALRIAGFGDARIVERWGAKFRDGTITRDASETRTAADHWAEYRVFLDRPITAEQALFVRRLIERAAPARCHLKLLDFTETPFRRDGTIQRDGTYTRGGA
jgi:phage tail P2-like protein